MGKQDPGPLRHVAPLADNAPRPVLRQPARGKCSAPVRKPSQPSKSSHPSKVTVPDPKPSVSAAPIDPDRLPWKTVEVSKIHFIGLLTRTTFDHDAWGKAVKEAEAGKDFAKQAAARSIETLLKTPPVLSGHYSNKNQQAKEWVTARSYELKYQAFEKAARSGAMPEYHESNIGPTVNDAMVVNGGYIKSAWQMKDGFLGPDHKQLENQPANRDRFVSADGTREVRMIQENGKARMEFLTIGKDSVSAVKLELK